MYMGFRVLVCVWVACVWVGMGVYEKKEDGERERERERERDIVEVI